MEAAANTASISENVIRCVADSLVLETDEIKLTNRLIPDLGADSLDFMDIMFQLEQAFGIKMQKEDLNFLEHINMSEEQAVKDGELVEQAKQALLPWLPQLPMDKPVALKDLGTFISVETLCKVVEVLKRDQIAGGG